MAARFAGGPHLAYPAAAIEVGDELDGELVVFARSVWAKDPKRPEQRHGSASPRNEPIFSGRNHRSIGAESAFAGGSELCGTTIAVDDTWVTDQGAAHAVLTYEVTALYTAVTRSPAGLHPHVP